MSATAATKIDSGEEALVGGLVRRVGGAVRAGVTWLSELMSTFVSGVRELTAVALLVGGLGSSGCQSGAASTAPEVQVAVTNIVEVKPPIETGPKVYGKFRMTFYYVIGEDEVRPAVAKSAVAATANDNQGETANDNVAAAGEPAQAADPVEVELAAMAMAPNDLVPVYSHTCEAIADVSTPFLQQLRVQGTGRLRDGRVLTVWGPCECARSPCFQVTEHQWGRSGNGRALLPFRTVAVDPRVVKLGSMLFIPELEGRTMPGRAPWGGFVHDGCVLADDTGGSIKNAQLDLFVGRRGWYNGLSEKGRHSWARGVTVIDGTKKCERKGRSVTRKAGAI